MSNCHCTIQLKNTTPFHLPRLAESDAVFFMGDMGDRLLTRRAPKNGEAR